jgi:hypothetical protein
MNTSDFRFFRSVEGQIFMRPGTGIAVGATRSPTGWAFQPEINAIPKAEIQKFFAEYSRAFRSGALAECTADEFEAENQDVTPVATKPKKKSKESEA